MAKDICNEFEHIPRSRSAAPSARLSPLSKTEKVLRGFEPIARRKLRRLIKSSPRIAELSETFPGAAYVVATRCRPDNAIEKGLCLINQGAPLRDIAKALDIPYWLRRLPAQAFQGELRHIPATERFARRILNKLPQAQDQSAFWLATVCFSAKAAHEDFAIWLAGQSVYGEPDEPAHLYSALCAYAWHSTTNTPARDLLVAPWRREMSMDTAICAAKSWLNRLRLVVQIGQDHIKDPWLNAGACRGFRFLPLTTANDILAEAKVMQNCADQYASRLAINKCRLFSVRRHNKPVATLEIASHPRETAFLTITQLKARHNMPASIDVWQAAYAWLASQKGLKNRPTPSGNGTHFDEARWHELMRPYMEHKAGAPWIPASPNPTLFNSLDAGIADLARRSGVTSWLFT